MLLYRRRRKMSKKNTYLGSDGRGHNFIVKCTDRKTLMEADRLTLSVDWNTPVIYKRMPPPLWMNSVHPPDYDDGHAWFAKEGAPANTMILSVYRDTRLGRIIPLPPHDDPEAFLVVDARADWMSQPTYFFRIDLAASDHKRAGPVVEDLTIDEPVRKRASPPPPDVVV